LWFPQTRREAGFHPFFVVLCTLCALFGSAGNAQLVQRLCTVTVRVRSADGSPSDIQATVNLYYFASGSPLYTATPRAGLVTFRNLPPARYSVEVTAPGYQTVTQPVDLQLGGESEQVSIDLTRASAVHASSSSTSSAVPVIAPNAQKELAKILEDLRTNHNADAQKRLEKVSRTAPSYPDVNYLWGAYYSQTQDRARAKEYWEKTLQEDPRHVFALVALAQVANDQGDLPGAIAYLERAVNAQPSSWPYQLRLAAAYVAHQESDKAEKCALRATELGKEHAADAHVILAQIYAKRHDRGHAIEALEAFLAAAPASPRAPEVRQWIVTLRASAPAAATPTPPADAPAISFPPAVTDAPVHSSDLMPPPKWLPVDVDDNMPPVEPGVACPLDKIQQETGERVREFISAVNRISATEYLDNEVLDNSGLPKRRESRRYNYVVTVSRISTPQSVKVEEYRNGSLEVANFPEHVATLGLPAMVLVFDPAFRNDYDMSCEGLSHGHGDSRRLTWQVHFRQKPDKPARIRGYQIGLERYALPFRGRAWITTDSFQVVGLETDIVAPIPAIRLKAEHDFIEYAPVKFSKSSQELWLPASAELFLDFHGHRLHRRHYFRDYLLFSVDEIQKISDPKAALESETAASPQ
jgi:tetratricopeptide (TPR) repeat protein